MLRNNKRSYRADEEPRRPKNTHSSGGSITGGDSIKNSMNIRGGGPNKGRGCFTAFMIFLFAPLLIAIPGVPDLLQRIFGFGKEFVDTMTAGRAVIIVIAVIEAVALIIIAVIMIRRREKLAGLRAKEARAEVDRAEVEFNRQRYQDMMEGQYIAVTCPNCGGSAVKIRKNTVEYCKYCGSAIKVDKDGKVI